MGTINKFENERIKYINDYYSKSEESNQILVNNCNERVNEMNSFCLEWNEYMASIEIDEQVVIKATDLLLAHRIKVEEEKKENAGVIFNHFFCDFKRNTEEKIKTNLIGDLSLNQVKKSKF